MGVPSRVYVGILVFAVMASVMVGAYTGLILGGYTPEPDAPYQVFFPEEPDVSTAFQGFLVVASLSFVLLTVWAWRSLVAAARRDQDIRRLMAEGKWPPKQPERPLEAAAATPTPAPVRRREEEPPGYG